MIKVRLSAMMFIQFFVWGAWYTSVSIYMGKNGLGAYIPWAFSVSPIGAIVSPFFLGMIADRYFSTEKVLAVLHTVGGVAIFLAPIAAEQWNSPVLFIVLLGIHMMCYMPTLGLTNSLAFSHMTNQEKEFPIIRSLGTFGWIVAGVVISSWLHADASNIPLKIAGIAGIVMGIYSLTLPNTPPPAAGQKASARDILGVDAIAQLQGKSFNVFIIASFLICIPLSVYYAYASPFVTAANIADPVFKMTFGQMSEFLFILVMPFFFRFLGIKWMILIGMLAWVLRYVLFAVGAPDGITWMILGGIILHGICYDFFFVTGQIYVDKKANPKIRAQAQGFIVLVTYGLGMLVGAQVSGWIFNSTVSDPNNATLAEYGSFWWIPAIFAAVVMLFFFFFFNEKLDAKQEN